jgi:YHS domain-containing protein
MTMNSEPAYDPVCDMRLAPGDAYAKSEYAGRTIYFCHGACKTLFDWHPERYLPKLEALAPSGARES